MPLIHRCQDWNDPTSKPLPVYGGEWKIMIVYDTHKTTMVQIEFCPHCGLRLPSACGCCMGTGVYKGMDDSSGLPFEHVCEICHGSGEEQD